MKNFKNIATWYQNKTGTIKMLYYHGKWEVKQ
jgi:hypothetical protein